ncbi:hypothetical protein ANCCEY_00510 [Ancylostoma ceylanicum]|uniref:Uncharacterized protein n=1 Tax=Ancylostoma ceylanicum TaxID=53326 RepID=A0A0D6MA38_9BILA|nr:hypothetical protein ANCCEY_00510 [Ancylostoma ceylanicum]
MLFLFTTSRIFDYVIQSYLLIQSTVKDGGFGGGGGGGNLKIRPPTDNRGRKVATFDPNYQTLAGLNNDDVFKPKGGKGPGGGNLNIRPPTDNRGRKVATFDPNYQTLAGLNNDDVFKPKDGGKGPFGGGGGGGNLKIRPPTDNRGRKVATFDPNYQTLAGLNNDDVFKPKTLAAINANIFGEDKKKPKAREIDRWSTY